MRQFFRRGHFEIPDMAPSRVDAVHDMLDGAVLAGGVHPLQDNEHALLACAIQQFLLALQFRFQLGLQRIGFFMLDAVGVIGIVVAEIDVAR